MSQPIDLDALERLIATVPIQHHFRDYVFHDVMPALITELRASRKVVEAARTVELKTFTGEVSGDEAEELGLDELVQALAELEAGK